MYRWESAKPGLWGERTIPCRPKWKVLTKLGEIIAPKSALTVQAWRWQYLDEFPFFTRVVSSSRSISSLLPDSNIKHESTVRIEPFHPKYLNLRYKEIIFPQKKNISLPLTFSCCSQGAKPLKFSTLMVSQQKVMRFHIYTKKNSPKRPVHWRCRHQAPRTSERCWAA